MSGLYFWHLLTYNKKCSCRAVYYCISQVLHVYTVLFLCYASCLKIVVQVSVRPQSPNEYCIDVHHTHVAQEANSERLLTTETSQANLLPCKGQLPVSNQGIYNFLADAYAVKLSKTFQDSMFFSVLFLICPYRLVSSDHSQNNQNTPENTSEDRLCAEFVASLMLLANLNAWPGKCQLEPVQVFKGFRAGSFPRSTRWIRGRHYQRMHIPAATSISHSTHGKYNRLRDYYRKWLHEHVSASAIVSIVILGVPASVGSCGWLSQSSATRTKPMCRLYKLWRLRLGAHAFEFHDVCTTLTSLNSQIQTLIC